jgi:hypothetical protein
MQREEPQAQKGRDIFNPSRRKITFARSSELNKLKRSAARIQPLAAGDPRTHLFPSGRPVQIGRGCVGDLIYRGR